jgi:hypothetical protein
MANNNDLFIPSEPRNLSIRPLNKGMMRHLATQGIPDGGFYTAKNVYISTNGIKRRNPYIQESSLGSATYPRIQDLGILWKTDGSQVKWVIDNNFLYDIGTSSWSPKYWIYDTGDCSVSGTTVTGSGTAWNTTSNYIRAGDYIVLDADGSGDGPETVEIGGITNDTTLTLISTPSGTYGGGTDYDIYRAFGANDPYLVDWALVPNKVVFTDNARPPYEYDGTNFSQFDDSYIAQTVAYWKRRVWLGRTTESGTDHRDRIRWSNVSPITTFDSGDYYGLDETQGTLRKILPNGNLLYVYFDDTIYVGRPGNYPYPAIFQKLETGGVGLVGMKALCQWFDGHFYVGQDDIYFISQAKQERIGIPVVSETIEKCEHQWRIYATPDPKNNRICFGFPEDSYDIEKIWSYNYKTQAWSYDEIDCTALRNIEFVSSVTWADWMEAPYTTGTVEVDTGTDADGLVGSGTSWSGGTITSGEFIEIDTEDDDTYSTTNTVDTVVDDTHITCTDNFTSDFSGKSYRISSEGWSDVTYPTWGSIQPQGGYGGDLYMARNLKLYKFETTGSLDNDTDAISVELVTKDFDHGQPDIKKLWNRMSFKLNEITTSDIIFHVYGSVDRGQTWKTLTPSSGMTITAGFDEFKVDFRLKGSIARFKITSNSEVDPWIMTEIVLRARTAGVEIQGRNT